MTVPDETRGAEPKPPRRIRWWLAMAILGAGLAAYAAQWFLPHRSQQHFNIRVAQVVILTTFGLLAWVLFLSNLRWRTRLLILGALFGSVGLIAATHRIRGVTGNLVPILEPRWTRRPWQEAPKPVPTPASEAQPALIGAADFPQFLGPDRNGRLPGPKLETNWTSHPPKLLWRHPLGAAWSGFAVAGAIAVTQEQRDDDEVVTAYDLVTGTPLWTHADRERYFTTLAGEGPRATPTIAGRRVITQGATGVLNCLDLATGQVLWHRNIFQEHGGHMPEWGHASSPLVQDSRVIVSAGGRPEQAVVAYRLEDGIVQWAAGRQSASYSSPMIASLGGVRQIVLFGDALAGYDAETGRPLWRWPWPGGHPHIAMPVLAGDSDLILSSGYGTGSGRVRIERNTNSVWTPKPIWRTNRMKAKFANLLLLSRHVYGLDDGIMACLDAETGTLKWKDGRYGHGQVLLVGALLLVLAESGEVVLIDPRPDQLHELTRFTALTDKTWNPPAVAGKYLLVRNDKEAACFSLPVVE